MAGIGQGALLVLPTPSGGHLCPRWAGDFRPLCHLYHLRHQWWLESISGPPQGPLSPLVPCPPAAVTEVQAGSLAGGGVDSLLICKSVCPPAGVQHRKAGGSRSPWAPLGRCCPRGGPCFTHCPVPSVITHCTVTPEIPCIFLLHIFEKTQEPLKGVHTLLCAFFQIGAGLLGSSC